jgi:hypothetical protein
VSEESSHLALRKRRWLRLLAFSLLVASCLAAFYLGSRFQPRTEAEPSADEIGGLSVEASALDVGEVWEENAFRYSLPLHNTTDRPIRVLDFTVSCTCVGVEPRGLEIPPHQSAAVQLTFDLTHRMPAEIGEARRPFRFEIAPAFGTEQSRQPGWVLHGVARSRVVLSAAMLQFGEQMVQGQSPPERRVAAKAFIPIQRLEARAEPPLAQVRVERRDGDRGSFEMSVTPHADLPPGPFHFDVLVEPLTESGERLPAVMLPVAGQVQPAVLVIPTQLLLSSVPVGRTVEGEVVLQTRDGARLIVDKWEPDSPDIQVEPIEGDRSSNQSFRVVQTVRSEGDHNTAVRFTARTEGREAVIIPMRVWCRGIAVKLASGGNP